MGHRGDTRVAPYGETYRKDESPETAIMLRVTCVCLCIMLVVLAAVLSLGRQAVPQSAWVVVESGQSGNQEIVLLRLGGSTRQRQLTFHSGFDTTPTWTPRGDWIGFVSDRAGSWDIYRVRPYGLRLQQLTDDQATDYAPAWSPDGKWIAFVSDRGGNLDIYLMNADGSNQHPLTTHAAPDYAPSWSADGAWITFVSERGGGPNLHQMRLDGTESQMLTQAQPGHFYLPAGSPIAMSPIVDLPLRAWILMLAAFALFAWQGVVFALARGSSERQFCDIRLGR